MKPFDVVRVRLEYIASLSSVLPTNKLFVFLGEINQIPGHGIFAAMGTDKLYSGDRKSVV